MRAYVFFFIFHFFLFPSRRMSCFRPTQRHKPTRAHYPHNSAPPTALSDGFRPDWWTPTSFWCWDVFCCCDARSSSGSSAAAPVPAIDLSSEESKDNASDLLAGASHTSAEVLIISGSTATHSKVNVDATFGQEMSPALAYFTKFSREVPSGLNQGNNVKCCLVRSRRRHGVSPIHSPRQEGHD